MQIKDLPASTSLASTDVLAKDTSSGTTQKITGENLASQIKTLGNLLGTGDVVNNLTSTATNAPLSAAQGKELASKIDQCPICYKPDGSITTGSNGAATINTGLNLSGRRVMAIANYADSLSTQYGVYTQSWNSNGDVVIRVRKINDGSVVADTTLSASNIMLFIF